METLGGNPGVFHPGFPQMGEGRFNQNKSDEASVVIMCLIKSRPRISRSSWRWGCPLSNSSNTHNSTSVLYVLVLPFPPHLDDIYYHRRGYVHTPYTSCGHSRLYHQAWVHVYPLKQNTVFPCTGRLVDLSLLQKRLGAESEVGCLGFRAFAARAYP